MDDLNFRITTVATPLRKIDSGFRLGFLAACILRLCLPFAFSLALSLAICISACLMLLHALLAYLFACLFTRFMPCLLALLYFLALHA